MARSSRSSRSSRSRPSSGRSSSRSGGSRGASSRAGTSSRASSRSGGGRRGGYGGGKSSNAGPAILAGVLIVAAIGLLIALTAGNKDETETAKIPPRVTPRTTMPDPEPEGPTRLDPPTIPQSLRDEAMEVVREARPLAEQGQAAMDAASEARSAGDDELWQEKLHEASNYFGAINDLWNELILKIDAQYTNRDWDAEQVANHYLGSQASTISGYLRRYQEIRKQRRR